MLHFKWHHLLCPAQCEWCSRRLSAYLRHLHFEDETDCKEIPCFGSEVVPFSGKPLLQSLTCMSYANIVGFILKCRVRNCRKQCRCCEYPLRSTTFPDPGSNRVATELCPQLTLEGTGQSKKWMEVYTQNHTLLTHARPVALGETWIPGRVMSVALNQTMPKFSFSVRINP